MPDDGPSIFHRWRLITPLLILVVVGVGFGCGSNDGETLTTTTETTSEPDTTTTDDQSTTTTEPDTPPPEGLCAPVAPVPSGATDTTTAPVDFDGDGTADNLLVYQATNSWHVRAEIANVGVADVVVAGPGPAMTAVGGATINNDTLEEAWVKVGSGSATDIVSVFMLDQCALQQVLLNGIPAEFPIGASATAADGLGCYGFDVGIEVFTTTSGDAITYAGSSQIYTLDLSGPTPIFVLGATAAASESNPPGGPAFDALSRFNCDNLMTIP